MINKTLTLLITAAFLFLSQVAHATDIPIIDKIVAKDSSFIPKNKNEPEYRKYLKSKFHKTYLQYIKLEPDARELVYEQYAEKSFPRIENTKKAIMQLLK